MRHSFDVEWFHGPLGASAESITVIDNRFDQGLVSGDLTDVRAASWCRDPGS